jgi:hypothetical protein
MAMRRAAADGLAEATERPQPARRLEFAGRCHGQIRRRPSGCLLARQIEHVEQRFRLLRAGQPNRPLKTKKGTPLMPRQDCGLRSSPIQPAAINQRVGDRRRTNRFVASSDRISIAES